MTAPNPSFDEALLDAASLAFAMIRFAEGAAHPPCGAHPPDTPRVGKDVYVFAPSYRRVPRAPSSPFVRPRPA